MRTKRVALATCWELKLEEWKDGTWGWELRYYGKMLARSHAPSEKKAQKAGEDEFLRMVKVKAQTTGQRKLARLKLRQLLERRTYVIAGLIELLIMGADRDQVVREIAEQERVWWKNDPNPVKKPLSTHHLMLPADKVALQAIEAMKVSGLLEEKEGGENGDAGWKAQKAIRWGKEMIGASFFEDGDQAGTEEDAA